MSGLTPEAVPVLIFLLINLSERRMTYMKTVIVVMSLVLLVCFPAMGFAAHQEEKAASKGIVTKIAVTEYEVTLKDDKGKETKVKVKEISDVKVGDGVIVTKEGKIRKEVKPKTGGY